MRERVLRARCSRLAACSGCPHIAAAAFYASVGLFLGRVGRGHDRDVELRGVHMSRHIRRRQRHVGGQGCPCRQPALHHFECPGHRSRTLARSPCRRPHVLAGTWVHADVFLFFSFFVFFSILFSVFFVSFFASPPRRVDFHMGAAAHIAPPVSAFIRTSAAAGMPPRVLLVLLPVAAQRLCINSVSKRRVTGANVATRVTIILPLH